MMKSSRFWMFFLLIGLALVFQNCTSAHFDSSTDLSGSTPKSDLSGNGGVYEGKLRILHHYVDNFKCEGRAQPESILIRLNDNDWQRIQNTTEKCASIDQQDVSGVVYDDILKQAQFENRTYIAPRPYLVDANEDPNLPDVKLIDGVCEDKNGKCSLLAATQQAVTTSLTEAVLVQVPGGTYGLTSPLVMSSSYTNSQAITVRGADPLTTILDGNNAVGLLRLDMATTAMVSIENLTFQNGYRSSGMNGSSAISPGGLSSGNTHLDIVNCILKNNKDNPPISAAPGSGNIRIRQSQFIGNQSSAIEVFAATSLLVEDTTIVDNTAHGILVWSASNITLRRSTFSNNGGVGILFRECSTCVIENLTVFQNQLAGVQIWTNKAHPQYDLVISNSTIVENGIGLPTGSNITLAYFDSTNKLFLNNSILAMNNVAKSNCSLNPGQALIANNSLFDDGSCLQTGSGNIQADPQLGPLTNNGGFTQTMLPLPGSAAIDAGANSLCSHEDQRGLPRPMDKLGSGPRCDIGAVELQ